MEHWTELIPEDIKEKYELHNYNSAVEILFQAYPEHFHNIMDALSQFSISIQDILQSGGNESAIPKKWPLSYTPRVGEKLRFSAICL